MLKDFVIDDIRFKFRDDHFIQRSKEALESIRFSERNIYQRITDIFSECSVDYDKNSAVAQEFFAFVRRQMALDSLSDIEVLDSKFAAFLDYIESKINYPLKMSELALCAENFLKMRITA